MIYICFFRDGGCLIDTEPNGDRCVPIELKGQASRTLAALLELESFRLSEALAALYLDGVRAGERAVRGHGSVSAGSRSGPAAVRAAPAARVAPRKTRGT
jgi:hypothetical protein